MAVTLGLIATWYGVAAVVAVVGLAVERHAAGEPLIARRLGRGRTSADQSVAPLAVPVAVVGG